MLGTVLLTSACTNSKLVIGSLYNRLDDRMRDEFDKLAEFDERQEALFDAAVGTGHVWHRQTELPLYAAIVEEIASSVARPGRTSREDVTRWAQAVEARSVAARACHPANFSFELMRSLSEEQIASIEARFASERAENRERYESRTAEERRAYRQKNVEKWARRIGVDFTAEQRAMLRTTFERQISLRREYYRLSDAWNRELFRIARDRQAPDYDARMGAHLDALWSLLETAHAEEWQRNRELWRDFAYRFVAAMTDEQRAAASEWLGGLADTLAAISRDEPSFTPGDDPSVGCLVETTASEGSPGRAEPAG